MKHTHADNMLAYAQDAQETETPWKSWEYSNKHSKGWCLCDGHPAWSDNTEYRRKPRTIRIGNYDVPEPLRVAPEIGTPYYRVNISNPDSPVYCEWSNGDAALQWLKNGIIHIPSEAAELHAKSLISLTEQ